MQETLLKIDILKEDYRKTFKKFTWFNLLHSVFFYGQDDYEDQKKPGTSQQSQWVPKHLEKNSFLVMYHPGNFDGLMQSGFWVIPKITFAILCKPIQFYLTLWIW